MITTTKTFCNVLTLMLSIVIGLMVCEIGARLILNPADYLSVEMVPDDALGAVPSPTSRIGFDAWGFRNRRVPARADIVAIGDSHTYGNTASMEDSWPYVLGRLSGQHVYNMGMGGYGPNQYLYLLQTRALSLKPKTIVCGLYMGDDFENAFSITYGLDYWTRLRRAHFQNVSFNIWDKTPESISWHKKSRVWLSRYSILYQITFHGPLIGTIEGNHQIRRASTLHPGDTTAVDLPEKHILEAFRPEGLLQRLDQHSEPVQEGMRLTFELLQEMNDLSRQNHMQLLVLVIPTKEMVFSEYLEHKPNLALGDVLDSLIANERVARAKTFEFLTNAGIAYIDPLPSLKAAVTDHLYARTAVDMHPSRNGYKVIAEAVCRALASKSTQLERSSAATTSHHVAVEVRTGNYGAYGN